MSKVNGSRFKLYVVESTTVANVTTEVEKIITEQTGLTISRNTNTIDTTSKDNNGYESFIGGLKSGEISLEMIMDADVTALPDKVNYLEISDYEATRAVKTYRAKLVGDTKTMAITFQALITKFDVGAPMEDKITVSMTMKRSGAPTQTTTVNP